MNKQERDAIISQIIAILYKAGANAWSVQDKGTLLGAIKLQLVERAEKEVENDQTETA